MHVHEREVERQEVRKSEREESKREQKAKEREQEASPFHFHMPAWQCMPIHIVTTSKIFNLLNMFLHHHQLVNVAL